MGLTQFLRSDILQQDIIDLYDPNDSISCEFYCSLLELSTKNIVYKDLSKVDKDKILEYYLNTKVYIVLALIYIGILIVIYLILVLRYTGKTPVRLMKEV